MVRVDAETLDPIGKPVRYTAFQGNDRFPDVFCQPLPLGSHFVEGPTRLDLRAPDGQDCHWQVDGAEVGVGPVLNHQFTASGDHWVTATAADGVPLRGLVHVREAKAPALSIVRRRR